VAGEVDLNALLAGPIIAMNDAQADAAASFFELFEQFAFEPPRADAGPSEPRRLRMISFVAERAIASGVERREISMPLLQMIPIGGVAIDTARIQFSVALTADAPPSPPPGPPPVGPRPAGGPVAPVAPRRFVMMKARIAPGIGTTAFTAADAAGGAGGSAEFGTGPGNLQVEIVLKQIDLPAGYLDMIAETQGGMSRRIDEPAPAPGSTPDPSVGPPLFAATVRGLPERLTPGQRLTLVVDITPEPAQIGPAGLALEFAGDPPDAIAARVPNSLRQVGPEPASGRLSLSIGDVREKMETALVIQGAATGPDGVPHRHMVRVPLPPVGASA
jgi:hypothetical protein